MNSEFKYNFFTKKNKAPPERPEVRMEHMNLPYSLEPYLEHFSNSSLFQKRCFARQKKIANVRCRHMTWLIITYIST